MSKKPLSALLALCMVLALLPAALAADGYRPYSVPGAFGVMYVDGDEGGLEPATATFGAAKVVKTTVDGGRVDGPTGVTIVLVRPGSSVTIRSDMPFERLDSSAYPCRYLGNNHFSGWEGYRAVLRPGDHRGNELTVTAEEFFASGADGQNIEALWVEDHSRDGEGNEVTDHYVIMLEGLYDTAPPIQTPPPAQSEAPTQPESTPQSETPARTAVPTKDTLTVDGELHEPTAYKISGSNYFLLRDVAMMLNGTPAQFSVDYDRELRAVVIVTGDHYISNGTELQGAPQDSAKAKVSNDAVYIDGEKVELSVYKIGGANYFKIRDLGRALKFNVGYKAGTGVFIESDKEYTDAD